MTIDDVGADRRIRPLCESLIRMAADVSIRPEGSLRFIEIGWCAPDRRVRGQSYEPTSATGGIAVHPHCNQRNHRRSVQLNTPAPWIMASIVCSPRRAALQSAKST
jgi:hypothetical protein